MHRLILAGLLLAAGAASGTAQAQDASRGKLLYETHCIQCHTEQMHWRAQRRATDWATLKVWVRRWQGEARLEWSEDDVEAVAHHLNDTIYGFPRPVAAGTAARN